MMKRTICLLGLLAQAVCADLSFAPIFNDGAVLQCDMPVNVWGTADPRETVTVTFAGQEKTAIADASGKWFLQLDPLKASDQPRSMVVVSQVSNFKFQVANVVVGEVWLATGQSNMSVSLVGADGGRERLKMTLPHIRLATVPRQTGMPAKPMDETQLAWDTFRPGPNGKIAAVAFFFAEHLQKNIGGTVGILQCSYGGTPCQAWTPEWALDEKPELKYYADLFRKGCDSGKSPEEQKAAVVNFFAQNKTWNEWHKNRQGPRPDQPQRPAEDNLCFQQAPVILYENMIKAIIPYTARGVIWYQGEGNASKPEEYRTLFPTMIEAWRKDWKRPELPFYFVQLAAYGHPTIDWSGLRAAQAFTRDTVPHTGMALAIDVGEEHQIHPRAKQPVGERLARLALADVYGRDVVTRGPHFQTLEKKKHALRVVFQCSDLRYSESAFGIPQKKRPEGEWQQKEGAGSACLETSDGGEVVPGFEVAGKDGEFYPADAAIVAADTVELSSPDVKQPVSVRYAWHSWIEPPVTLQNSAGLPAEPFCSN